MLLNKIYSRLESDRLGIKNEITLLYITVSHKM